MRSRFPQFRVKQRGLLDLEFIGTLLVKDGFPVYTISVHYQGDLRPVVKVLKPDLVAEPPHFFKASDSLCLYKSTDYSWNRRRLIAIDIIPWAAAWVYFYEVWLQTGIWYGPEASHDTNEIK